MRLWRSLQGVASDRVAEVDRLARAYTGDIDGVELLTKEELAKRIRRKDDLLVLDVRPEQEYAAGHVPGAVSIPVAELKRRLKELPKNKEIVAYCRGSFCAFAPEAARYLEKKGFHTSVLDAGLPIGRPLGCRSRASPSMFQISSDIAKGPPDALSFHRHLSSLGTVNKNAMIIC